MLLPTERLESIREAGRTIVELLIASVLSEELGMFEDARAAERALRAIWPTWANHAMPQD